MIFLYIKVQLLYVMYDGLPVFHADYLCLFTDNTQYHFNAQEILYKQFTGN